MTVSDVHFYGEASERRPWAIQRDARPACRAIRFRFAPRQDTPPPYIRQYPIPAFARFVAGNNLRIAGGNIVIRYSQPDLAHFDTLIWPTPGCPISAKIRSRDLLRLAQAAAEFAGIVRMRIGL